MLSLSCLHMRMPAEITTSPSGLYKLKTDVNNDKSDKTKYLSVLVTLYDKNYNQITTLQTGCSNTMKWAIDWYPKKDTIILKSSDIGIYAYRLNDKKQLDTITITKDIDSIANIIFQKKYSSR